VIDQIVRFGEVRRGRLGVETQDLTPDEAKQLGVTISEGAVVLRVEKGSAAEKAGLRPKDIVTAVNERPIRASGELRNRVGLTPIGEEVDMTVLREGRQIHVRARVGELFQSTSVAGESIPQLAGLKVADIQPGMPMHGRLEGVFVAGVDRESAAFRNGLRVGDVIVGVGAARVESVKQFTDTLRTAEQPLRISLLRGDYRITLVIR
jgi:serine protease Do/serine protease DegQ